MENEIGKGNNIALSYDKDFFSNREKVQQGERFVFIFRENELWEPISGTGTQKTLPQGTRHYVSVRAGKRRRRHTGAH